VRAINRVLSLIFGVIALTAIVGCAASLGGAFLANVDRKRKDLAVLRLLGIDSGGVIRYVLIQAILLSLIAYALGLGLYGLGSTLFNQLLVGDGLQTDFVCRITVAHALYALLMVAGLACVVAAIGAWRAVRVQPAESLREI
jgi:putative ABC transport system permease protein